MPEKGICNLSSVPVRAKPSDKREMVTQLLPGESYSVLKQKRNWLQIKMDFDGYEGWIDLATHSPHALPVSDRESQSVYITHLMYASYNVQPDRGIYLPPGSELVLESEKRRYYLNGQQVIPSDQSAINDFSSTPEPVVLAEQFLNAPYHWGGRSVFGLDCSGFIQVLFKICGFKLPRDANPQSKMGLNIGYGNQEPGDLAFFRNKKGKIVHIGLLMDKETIIHASGKVRKDKFTNKGIYNSERDAYTHFLDSIKRLY
jgi:cell wall-associated NlpC family hydrolase